MSDIIEEIKKLMITPKNSECVDDKKLLIKPKPKTEVDCIFWVL